MASLYHQAKEFLFCASGNVELNPIDLIKPPHTIEMHITFKVSEKLTHSHILKWKFH